MGPFPTVLGAPATACPAGPRRLCPASPPVGGAVWQGPWPRPPPALLKNSDQPVQEANLRGITISSHVSKLEPTAFYAVATAVYERALGGPCLVGGMRGVSPPGGGTHGAHEGGPGQTSAPSSGRPDHGSRKVFRRDRPGHPPDSGGPSGPGGGGPPRHPHRGFLVHPAPGPPGTPAPWNSSWGLPRAQYRGSMQEQRRRSLSCVSWTSRTGLMRWSPSASRGLCGWTTQSSSWSGATPAPYTESCWISGPTTRESCGWMSRTARSSTGRRPTRNLCGRPRRQPWPATWAARG